jgi:hypothetical protein
VLDTAPIGQSAGSALERQYAQRHGLQEMHGARIQVPRARGNARIPSGWSADTSGSCPLPRDIGPSAGVPIVLHRVVACGL